jgi:hypothetical protein
MRLRRRRSRISAICKRSALRSFADRIAQIRAGNVLLFSTLSDEYLRLPRGLNLTYVEWGGEKAGGVLLHAKFLDTFPAKAEKGLTRGQHYAGSAEYRAYAGHARGKPDVWCRWSERYMNWRQREIIRLMSNGDWA